jgi:GPH family glycoside/pentoside/hexuronide:cation symporter
MSRDPKTPPAPPSPAPEASTQSEVAATLTWTEKIGYASGDFASCLYFGVFMNFLAYFYTDVFGITAAAVGTMIFITRTWDWINDPMMGMIADRTKSRMGKFRPWLLWVLPFWAILGVLTFTTFDLSPVGKLIYAYATYTLLTMAYTAINVPYSALMGVMTARSEQRTVLSSFRFMGAFAAVTFVSFAMLPMVTWFGGGNEQRGFSLAVMVLAVVSSAAFVFTFFTTHERVQPPKAQPTNIWKDLGSLMRNVPWLILALVAILTITWIAVRSGVTIHYFKYASGSRDLGGVFLGISTAVQLFGVMMTKHVVRWLGGKKRAFTIITLINGAIIGLFYFIDPKNIPLIMAHQVISSIAGGPIMPLFWSMIADTADYGQWKFGHRATGLIFSTGTAVTKIGWSIGPAISLWLLDAYGFVANQDQTPDTIHGLHLIMSLIPAGVTVLAAGATLLYPINARMEKEMEAAIIAEENALKRE